MLREALAGRAASYTEGRVASSDTSRLRHAGVLRRRSRLSRSTTRLSLPTRKLLNAGRSARPLAGSSSRLPQDHPSEDLTRSARVGYLRRRRGAGGGLGPPVATALAQKNVLAGALALRPDPFRSREFRRSRGSTTMSTRSLRGWPHWSFPHRTGDHGGPPRAFGYARRARGHDEAALEAGPGASRSGVRDLFGFQTRRPAPAAPGSPFVARRA